MSRVLTVLCIALGTPSSLAQPQEVEPIDVVVTLQPWASLLRAVGGERVDVMTLLPAGASPHSFDPSPSQAVALAHADLIIMNGMLDDWLLRLLDATATSAVRVTVLDMLDVDALMTEVADGGSHAGHDTSTDHGDHGGINAHVWLDPVAAVDAIDAFVAELSAVDPEHSASYEANGVAVAARLVALDAELQAQFAPFAGSGIVPFHDAWVHFARRYQLEILATIEPFPGREPSAAYLTSTIDVIRSTGVSVIFSEGQLNDRTAQVVAESAGVRLVVLDPLGGAPGPEDYFELLRWNANTIVGALRWE